jgi:hypothetical protein
MPPRAELDALQATFETVFEKWRVESPRNLALLKQVQTEVARVRAGE